MKLGILLTDSGQIEERNSEINVGAIWIYKSILNIYNELGIDESQLIRLTAKDIDKYSGDDVVLPICMHIPQNHINENILNYSDKVKPVFLAISMTKQYLNESQVIKLKKSEPIGCRDQHTYETMTRYGIKAFIMGCLVLTTPSNIYQSEKKNVVYSDVPLFAKDFIPQEYKSNAMFVKQELLKSEMSGKNPFQFADEIKAIFERKASIVLTSRFHAAIMAIACNIPYILINEAYTYRYSWLQKFGNFYTRDNIENISYRELSFDVKSLQNDMKNLSKCMIVNKCFSISPNDISQLINKRIIDDLKTINVCDLIKNVSNIFRNDNEQEEGLIDYYDGAIEYINKHWSKTDIIKYSFWGVNNNAKAIDHYISTNYPLAVLSNIYDAKKVTCFRGLESKKPELISDDEFVFVTTFAAKGEANELFDKIGKKKYYICERNYINYNDIR